MQKQIGITTDISIANTNLGVLTEIYTYVKEKDESESIN